MKSVRKIQNQAIKRRRRSRIRLLTGLSALGVLIIILIASGGAKAAWTLITGLLEKPAAETTESNNPTPTPSETKQTAPLPTTISMPTPSPSPAPQEVRVTLAAVGDIILHKDVIDGGLVSGSNPATYDFNPIFQYVKPILAAADLTLANYEGTLAGSPYRGYPFFCAPDQIADALLDTGIDGVWTANNHTLDRGLAGVIRTAKVFRDRGFEVVGTRHDLSAATDVVRDVGGIRIGLMAYTFETIGTETQKALNGNPMPAAADPLIDSFNPYRQAAYEKDIKAMIARAAALRTQGAEIICLSLHWGDEYHTRSNSYQRKLAQRLADAGIELIIGHHPHVLQEIDVLQSATTGKPALVFYSLSNFLHNMSYETHGSNGNAQDAVIARIHLLRKENGVSIEWAEYIPTYVVRVNKDKDRLQHLIVPVLPALDSPSAYQTTAKEMQASLDRITAVLGSSQGNSQLPVKQAAK
jgi:poly-gamma-glutamate capsule biosynthesis protein CapA/YwtB (metallophosphatase superfamily)